MSPIRTLAVVILAGFAVACVKLPVAPPDGVAYDILCPVNGTVSFSNDWMAPRSGGTFHEGTDILAPRWASINAVVDGEIKWAHGAKSGYAIWLDGDDGNEYFYAHLQQWAHSNATLGDKRDVVAGEIIGWVGDTGNATGTPHLHFEIHPGGEGPVNPYPTIYAVCTNRSSPASAQAHGDDVGSAADD